MKQLGRLQRIYDLRNVWPSEASDFTRWLAQENLELLGETIGIELELEAVEKPVGPFRADILCKDTATNTFVLVENQLEKTDHTHLGQILTYATGLSAVTIVWIAERFTDEHRAALDWLNEVTSDDINFFGLEIELWQIGDSAIAPKFNIISQPNDWTRTVSASRALQETSENSATGQVQLEYWTAFKEHLLDNKSFMHAPKPSAQYWTTLSLGRTDFALDATVSIRDKFVSVSLIIRGINKQSFFSQLEEQRSEIEAEMNGIQLEWRPLPDKKSSDIYTWKPCDPLNRDDWPHQHEWLRNTLETFHYVFSPRVKKLAVESPLSNQEE